jgi:hypothetical protein
MSTPNDWAVVICPMVDHIGLKIRNLKRVLHGASKFSVVSFDGKRWRRQSWVRATVKPKGKS